MRAIVITKPGGPEVLELREVPTPAPPPDHVRVRVTVAGVNRADLLQRMGRYPAPPGAPTDIPGLEYAGVVDEVGKGATRHRVGDRVYGLVAGGAYAEHVVVHEREAAPIPEGLTDEQAAAVPEAFVTAYDGLVVRGRLGPGDRALIHAAGSGVGTAAVQVARAIGALAIGTSRTEDKLERCKPLGLWKGIVPEGARFAEAVKAATDGHGADVILDLVGGAYAGEDLAAAAARARIVLVGLTAGAKAELDLGLALAKRLEIVGTVMRSRPLEEKIEAAHVLDRRIGPWLASGAVRPVVEVVIPITAAAEAHRLVGANGTFGKVLLRVA
jgi:putative PIG3 family NAD(P)H quinone oxidoreductase